MPEVTRPPENEALPNLDSQTPEEIREEVEMWRMLWEYTSEDARYYLRRVGLVVRFMSRQFKGILGTFLKPVLTVEGFEVQVQEKEYDATEGRYFNESKTVKLPASSVVYLEFIQERERREEEEEREEEGFMPLEQSALNEIGEEL